MSSQEQVLWRYDVVPMASMTRVSAWRSISVQSSCVYRRDLEHSYKLIP
jgi:hypothetical protein